jgi:hypothetical protein
MLSTIAAMLVAAPSPMNQIEIPSRSMPSTTTLDASESPESASRMCPASSAVGAPQPSGFATRSPSTATARPKTSMSTASTSTRTPSRREPVERRMDAAMALRARNAAASPATRASAAATAIRRTFLVIFMRAG